MAAPFFEHEPLSPDSDTAAAQILAAVREFSAAEQDVVMAQVVHAVVEAKHGDMDPFRKFVDALWVSVQLRRSPYFLKAQEGAGDDEFAEDGIDAGDLLGRLSRTA